MTYEVVDWLAHHAVRNPNKVALKELPSGREFTFSSFHERVANLAGFFESKGLKRGDCVAYLMLNSTDLLATIFACWRQGLICVAINFRLTPSEVQFILDDSETQMVLYDRTFSQTVEAIKGQTTVKDWVETLGGGQPSAFETALDAGNPIYEMTTQSFEDQCLLMYSSGTTGRPKGIIITHGMIYFNAASGVGPANFTTTTISLVSMPLFHIGGLNTTCLPVLWNGGSCVIARTFDPGEILKAVDSKDLGITVLFLVPAAYNALSQHPACAETDFSRITGGFTGADSVPISLVEHWLERGVALREGYGMTETAAAGCTLDEADIPHKAGSAGRSAMHSTIRIVDEAGRTCAPNVQGEIWFKGLCITPGYWRRPDANAESFSDGWFKSGDIGRMDEDGYIYIEDRIKDMYISGGEIVYPAEVENLIYQIPQIQEVAVIGVPDEKYGEAGCAVAALKPGQSLDLEAILGHIGESLARYKHPKYLHIVEALPRNGSGKVLKFQLRQSVPELLSLT